MQLLNILCISILMSWVSTPPSSDSPWAESYIDARKAALELNRPYVILFRSNPCSSCDTQKALFEKPSIQSIMDQSFIGLEVDISDFDGATLKKYYQVNKLPTLIIFSAKGELLYRYERVLTENQLIRALLKPKENVLNDKKTEQRSTDENSAIQVGVFSKEKGAKVMQDRLSRICAVKPNLIKEGQRFKVVFIDLKPAEVQHLQKQLDTYGVPHQPVSNETGAKTKL